MMRDSPFPGGTLLAQHDTKTVVGVALASAASVLAVLFAVVYPSAVVGLLALAVAVRVVTTVGGRIRPRQRGVRKALSIRVPFTDTVLKV